MGRRRGRGRAAALLAVALVLAACDAGGDLGDVGDAGATPSTTAEASEAPGAGPGGEPPGDAGSSTDAPTGSEAPEEAPGAARGWTPVPAPSGTGRATDEVTLGGVWGDGAFLLLTSGARVGAEGPVRLRAWEPAAGTWEDRAELPVAFGAWDAQAHWLGGRLVVLGRPSGDAFDEPGPWELWTWDPAGDVWAQRDAPPLGDRWGFTTTWTGDRLVLFGGMQELASDDDEYRLETLADGWAWDPEQDGWYALAPFPHDGRSGHAAVWNGRRLVAFGGGYASGRFPAEGEWPWERDARGAAAWDPATNVWTSIVAPDAVGPVVAATWTGDRIVWWNGASEGMPSGDRAPGGVWDTNTGDVAPLAMPPLELRRDEAPVTWIPERRQWVTFGGACGEGCNQNADDGAVWDAATNAWERLPDDHGLGRRHAPIAWTGEALLVVGGSVADQLANRFEDRLDGAAWHP